MEDHYFSGNSAAHPNTLRWLSEWPHRLVMLASCIIWSVVIWSSYSEVLVIEPFLVIFLGWRVEEYTRVVIPLPPSKSKVQEWQEAFAAGFRKLIPISSSSR